MRHAAVIAAALILAGCQTPRVRGGKGSASLSGGAPAVTITAPENPAQRSEQLVERTVTEEYAPAPVVVLPPFVPANAPDASLSAPSPDVGSSSPTPILTRRTTTERAQTSLGASQDLADIMRAAQQHWRAVAAVFIGLGLLVGAWAAFRREWPTPAGLLAVGGLACILTLNPWWGLGGIVISSLIVLAYRAASPVRFP